MFESGEVIDKPLVSDLQPFDLHEHFTPGDEVGFIVGERHLGQLQALQVRKLLPHEVQEAERKALEEHTPPSTEMEGKYREHGIVCRLKDTNGFIR